MTGLSLASDPAAIRARIAELEAANRAAPGWGAAGGARLEEIAGLEAALRRIEGAGEGEKAAAISRATITPARRVALHDLLTHTHAYIVSVVRCDVESIAIMDRDGDPTPGSIHPVEARSAGISAGCAILRGIEAVTGPRPLPAPWLRAVIDRPEALYAPFPAEEDGA